MKDIYTDSTLDFRNFILSMVQGKEIYVSDIAGALSNYANLFFCRSKGTVVSFLTCEGPAYGKKVTQGQFLDALASFKPAPSEIKFDCNIFGYNPVLKDGKITIGCQEFEVESIKEFAARYKKWKESPAKVEIADCYTDSSAALRAYVKEICPRGIDNCIYGPFDTYKYCSVLHGVLTGDDNKRGSNYLTPGQFIDRILSAKPVRENVKISRLGAGTGIITENGVETVHGTISHGIVDSFLAEFNEKVKL